MNTNIPNPIHIHEKLTTLIKERFGVFLEVEHTRYPHPVPTEDSNGRVMVTASTHVIAYLSLEDARNGSNAIGFGYAHCSINDRFERRKGLTIALRRLYRQLADAKSKNLI